MTESQAIKKLEVLLALEKNPPKPKFKRIVDYRHTKERREVQKTKSQTIPNMCYSVKELITKNANGTLPNLNVFDEYDGVEQDVNIDDFVIPHDVDLADIPEYKRMIHDAINLKNDTVKKLKIHDDEQRQKEYERKQKELDTIASKKEGESGYKKKQQPEQEKL